MRRTLVVLKPPPLAGTTFEINGERVVVGRIEESDVRIEHATVSRTHAAIERAGEQTVVVDLQSTNGTSVNDAPVRQEPRPLRNGDVLRVGEVELRFEAPSETSPGPSAPAPTPGPRFEVWRPEPEPEPVDLTGDVPVVEPHVAGLIKVGVVMLLFGMALYMTVFLGAFDFLASDSSTSDSIWGPQIGPVPVAVLGFAIACVGSVILGVAALLHLRRSAHRRQ